MIAATRTASPAENQRTLLIDTDGGITTGAAPAFKLRKRSQVLANVGAVARQASLSAAKLKPGDST